MKGFNPRWKDFPDYIIGITKEIWEDRKIAILHKYYSKDIIVRSPTSIIQGNVDAINQTMETLHCFPDRKLLGEDVVWSGTPEEGMLSSHLIYSTVTHSGHGILGEPTGKKIGYRVIADCHAINDQINDEWLVRDYGAIVRQLGVTPKEFVRKLIEQEGGVDKAAPSFTPDQDKQGPYRGRGNDNKWGVAYAEILKRIMDADMGVITEKYDRACQLQYPGGMYGHSWESADQFWMGLRSSLPRAEFKIEHQIGREDPMMPPRAAIRWSLDGKHEGYGAFGEPTGARVYVMGICHAEFGPWGLRRETVIFDEVAIWKQILMNKNNLNNS